MSNTKSTSRRVFNALSLFSSVQAAMIICSIVRTKVIAICLGTAGVAVFGLYNNALAVLNQLTQLSINSSSVREIAGSPVSLRSRLSMVVGRLGWILGLTGCLLTIAISPVLSRWTFGDTDHTVPFICLSVVVLAGAVSESRKALLQAHQLLNRLARASMWGGIAATVLSIVFIKVLAFDGIVPSILAFAVGACLAFIIESHTIETAQVSVAEAVSMSKPIIKLGMLMTVAIFTTVVAQYIFLAWLRVQMGVDNLGVYQAGYTIVNQYVGLAFSALSVEFYPRLSSVVTSRTRTQLFVKHELSMLLVGLTACIVLFMNMVPIAIHLLYDDSFLGAAGFVLLAAIGTIFKAVSFVFAFVILARGDGATYLFTETLSSILYLLFNIVGYKLGGLDGVGIAYILWYFAYAVSVYIVYRMKYNMGGVGRQLSLAGLFTALVASQATLCYLGFYLIASIVSSIVVPVMGLKFYRLFLKK